MVDVKRESLLFADVLVGLSIVLFLATHFLTSLSIARKVHVTKATYEAVLQYHEANPVAAWVLRLQGFGVILTYLISPALILGSYWVVRRTRNKLSCEFISVIFFTSALINVVNDLAAYLGMMA